MRLSRTRFWEAPLRLIQVAPFRCRECEHRFYASISYGQYKVQGEAASLAEREFSSEVISASAGGLRVGSRKWMSVFGLLTTCLIIGAIVGLKLGTKLPNGNAWGYIKSSLFPRAIETQKESPATEFTSFKPAVPEPSIKSSDVAATKRSSPPNLARGHLTSREESIGVAPPDRYSPGAATMRSSPPNIARGHLISREGSIGLSSSAVAVRTERPRLPPNVQATITSDNVVEVRVQIDNSGTVTSAKVVSAKGPVANSLAHYALEAARRWRFQPARDSGQPIGSDRVLEFPFWPSDYSPAQ